MVRCASLFSSAGLLLFPAAVAAQAVEPADPASDTEITVTVSAVTATKTETPLVETPQAVSVVPAKLFLERGARNVQETLRYSAGVTAEAYGLDSRGDTSAIRGLNPVEYL